VATAEREVVSAREARAARERQRRGITGFDDADEDEVAETAVRDVVAEEYEGGGDEMEGDDDDVEGGGGKGGGGDDDDDGGSGSRRAAAVEGDDEDEDDEEGGRRRGGRRVKALSRVAGEARGAPTAAFNEAGDAMEPFHLRQEREDGYFDEFGDYRWKKKSAEDRDAWLEEMDAIAPAQRAAWQATAAAAAPASGGGGGGDDDDSSDGSSEGSRGEAAGRKGDGGGSDDGDETDMAAAKAAWYDTLLAAVEGSETVAGALRRLGKPPPPAAAASAAAPVPPRRRDMTVFNAVTEAADGLLRSGVVDVYTMTRRALVMEANDVRADAGLPPVRLADAAAPAPAAPVPVSAPAPVAVAAVEPAAAAGVERWWKYKWSEAAGAEEFGPFPASQLAAWRAAGFFAAAPAWVQPAGPPTDAPPVPAATAAAAADGGDDSDGDIFAGVGGYKTTGAGGASAAWQPIATIVL